MKIKNVILIIIIIMIVSKSISLAGNSNETNFKMPDEKPAVNIQEYNETDTKIEKSTAENNNKKIYSKDFNSTTSINTGKTKRLLKTAQEDKYQGELITNRSDICDTFVSRDGNHYTYSLDFEDLSKVSIDRYCFETKENERVYNNNDMMIPIYNTTIHNNLVVKGTVIYYSAFSKTDENHLQICGYDTQIEEFVYLNTFEISKEDYANSFNIDKKGNICIVTKGENKNDIKFNLYDNAGKLIDDSTQDLLNTFYSVKSTYLNDRMIYLEAYTTDGTYIYPYDLIIKINNNVLEDNYSCIRNYGMEFHFLNEEETIAYDQYGEIVQILYDNNEIEVSILDNVTIGIDGNFEMHYNNSSDDHYIYAGWKNGKIIKYNWNTYKIERAISIGNNKLVIGVFKSEDKLFVEYMDSKYNVYALIIDYEEFNNPSQILEITEHTTLNRTKEDIQAKYDELKIVNKANFNDVYDEEPSLKAPYAAGTINDKVKTDTLNQINYFRWLAGVNAVSINDKYMEHAQSGAVLLTTSSQLMHKPAQPSDMTDEFYKKAVGATNASLGVYMSANISQYSPLAESIQGYVDDVYNIEPNVGHRLSIIDYKAKTTSFGYAEKYGVVDMFTVSSGTRTDDYTAWPSAGNFPVESINKNAMWSLGFDNKKYFIANDFELKLKANGKEYSLNSGDFKMYLDKNYSTFYYNLPSELITYLTDGKSKIQTNKKVEVELSGLANYEGNLCVIKYPVNFISAIRYQRGDVNGDGKVTLIDYGLVLAHVKRTKLLTGEELQRADVNGDGKVTLIDYGLILAHVKRTKLLF